MEIISLTNKKTIKSSTFKVFGFHTQTNTKGSPIEELWFLVKANDIIEAEDFLTKVVLKNDDIIIHPLCGGTNLKSHIKKEAREIMMQENVDFMNITLEAVIGILNSIDTEMILYPKKA